MLGLLILMAVLVIYIVLGVLYELCVSDYDSFGSSFCTFSA